MRELSQRGYTREILEGCIRDIESGIAAPDCSDSQRGNLKKLLETYQKEISTLRLTNGPTNEETVNRIGNNIDRAYREAMDAKAKRERKNG